MSLHFTLAKKVLAHAKDLLKHIFNEAGEDVRAMEQKFLDALKTHAEDELKKYEQKGEDALQHWQKAPRATDSTSVHAPADMKWDEEADQKAAEGDEKGKDDALAAPADNVTTFPASEPQTFGDANQGTFEAPERIPPVDPSSLPTEGAASYHGEPLPTGSSEPTKADGPTAVASDEKEKEEEKEKKPASEPATEPANEPTAPDAAASADVPVGGQDTAVADAAKAEQEGVPALNGGLDSDKGPSAEASAPSEETAPSDEAAPESDAKTASASADKEVDAEKSPA